MDSNVYEALRYIDPEDYDDWLKVGMALKHEGCSLQDWEEWSSSSGKYEPRVCAEKWRSFREQNTGAPVTAGTIIQMAKERGMNVVVSDGFGWDDPVEEISKNYNIVDKAYVKEEIVPNPPKGYKSVDDLCAYLTELFERDEYVGYCDKLTFENDRWVPKHGIKTRTAGELIDLLKKGGFDSYAMAARIAVMTLAVFMILNQLGIAREIVNSAFILILAALAVAFAISFGIGGKDQ